MALLFIDGFDKYGGANTSTTSVAALMAGEWNTVTSCTISAPLSATGQAIQNSGSANLVLSKTLATNYGRIIGGFRFSSTLVGNQGIQFVDNVTAQFGILIAISTGTITLRNGAWNTGTVIATGSASVSANTTHYLEWDVTLGNSAAYAVYLDGISIASGTGDTTATANSTISAVQFVTLNSASAIFDDFYLFDSTGTTNNAPLLTSPRIETTFPTSDSAVQFSIGASVLGSTVARVSTTLSTVANTFYVRPFTPPRSCTLNSLTMVGGTSSYASANLRPIVYADSAGVPGTLITSGSTVTGISAGAQTVMPATASLMAGTQYWLGFMADIALTNGVAVSDGGVAGRSAGSVAFAGGAPGTAPATSSGIASALLWGNVTLSSAANYYEVSQSPPPAANTSYVSDTTVGHEDLYNFGNLSVIPASIYAVAVKAWCARSDSGARTVSMRVSSSGTDGGGSATGQTPATSYAWVGSNFERDPNGSIAWTGVALNAATTGFKIDA